MRLRERLAWRSPASSRGTKPRSLGRLVVIALAVFLLGAQRTHGPEGGQPEEGLIIAVDISLSMHKKLPAVKRAVLALLDGLDMRRQYRVALVRFGTTVEQVLDVHLDGEVARGIVHSTMQSLRARDRWTHFDELASYLAQTVPTFSTGRVSALLYSDGECSPDPASGKRCVDPQSLGTRVPFPDFNLYLVRITATPRATPTTSTVAGEAQRIQVIESQLAELSDISRQILRQIEASPPHLIPAQAPAPPQPHVAPEAPPAERQLTTPGPSSDPDGVSWRQWLWPRVCALLVLVGGALLGLRWWHRRFWPLTLRLTLDGTTHEVPIDAVPTVVRLGPNVGCDLIAPALPEPMAILVDRWALRVRVPAAWLVGDGAAQKAPVQHEGPMVLYVIEDGELVRLTTSDGERWLTVERRTPHGAPEDDEALRGSSPLDVLGIR